MRLTGKITGPRQRLWCIADSGNSPIHHLQAKRINEPGSFAKSWSLSSFCETWWRKALGNKSHKLLERLEMAYSSRGDTLDAPKEPACPEIRLAVELQDEGPLAWIGRCGRKLLLQGSSPCNSPELQERFSGIGTGRLALAWRDPRILALRGV